MVEFYGCASKINLSYNNKLRARAWLAIGRTLRKVGVASHRLGIKRWVWLAIGRALKGGCG